MNNTELVTSKNKINSYKLFDQVAKTYDFLNILLSLGIDRMWRKKIISLIKKNNYENALDLATGTGDMAILLAQQKNIQQVTGIDLSKEMVTIGQGKLRKRNLSQKLSLKIGDGVNIPFENNSMDLITNTFGIRNFGNYRKSIENMYRVLRPKGEILIMEFSIPKLFIIRLVYLFYFRYILPLIGKIVSGHSSAYKYLNETVEDFPYGHKFAKELSDKGFQNIKIYPLTFGIASIYYAQKVK